MKSRLFDTAFDQAAAVTKINPEESEPYLISASFLQKQGVSEQAMDLLKIGVSKLPDQNPDQLQIAAALYYELKDFDRASELYTKAVSLHPNSIDAQIGLANVYIAQQL